MVKLPAQVSNSNVVLVHIGGVTVGDVVGDSDNVGDVVVGDVVGDAVGDAECSASQIIACVVIGPVADTVAKTDPV